MNEKPLAGRVALVTGSATGIGEAIARRLAHEGASVVIHGQHSNRESGEAIARELCEKGAQAIFIAAQLEEPEACAELIESAARQWGRLDILVNNAAHIVRSNIETTNAEIFDKAMAVNARAPFLLIQAARPHFQRAGGGRVLNIGSVNAYCGEAKLLAYSVSKGALMTLTRNLADALAPEGIRVNQINPGWVLTPFEYETKIRDGLPEDWPEKMPVQWVPGGRLFKPEEIAHFALMFLMDEAALVSGAVVEIEQHPIIGRNPVKEDI
jgi:NAD(P)-dependent dehydrogenase (short-subunit alcohol dehydrogenase family)